MFDVGFFELLVIGVVALIVIGPERLPKVARTAGMWIGRGRRFVGTVKQDIEREIKADELKRILDEQKKNNPLHEIIEDTKKGFSEIRSETAAAVKGAGAKAPTADKPAGDAKDV